MNLLINFVESGTAIYINLISKESQTFSRRHPTRSHLEEMFSIITIFFFVEKIAPRESCHRRSQK